MTFRVNSAFVPQIRRILRLFAALLLLAFASPSVALFAADETAPPPAGPSVPPDEAAQANATKLIHELFGSQIDAAKTPLAKDELSKKLLQQGIDSRADPAGQFVLFKMARELAVGVGDMPVALESLEEMGRDFRFDTLGLRQETLAALAKTALSPLQSRALADANWSALDEAIAADKFDLAKLIAMQGLAAAKRGKDADTLRQWTARAKDLDDFQSAFDDVHPALTTLEKKPLDPAANLAAGRYVTLVKGDWDHGLPMIALAKASPLEVLALAEMAPPEDADGQLKLADGWWDLADATADANEKERLQGRALYWYGTVLPNLAGLPKARVEKRLQESTSKIFARVQAAARGNKFMISAVVPPMPQRLGNRVVTFMDRPEEGGLVIGFEIGLGNGNDGSQYIRAIRPIFLTPHGETTGAMRGDSRGDVVTLRARGGFAVGGVTAKGTNRIEALSVTFMQIQGVNLNPRNAYSSDWYGSHKSAINTRLGGSGSPVIGIAGKADNAVQEFALVLTR